MRWQSWGRSTKRSISNSYKKRWLRMRRGARFGIVLLVVALLSVVGARELASPPVPVAVVGGEDEPTKTTFKEKKENRKLAKLYAYSGWGWRGREWVCLNALWSSESRFDHRADNKESSAFGIAQRLGERDTRPAVQILKGLRYIQHRYQTPCRAWNHWLKRYHY